MDDPHDPNTCAWRRCSRHADGDCSWAGLPLCARCERRYLDEKDSDTTGRTMREILAANCKSNALEMMTPEPETSE